MEHSTINYNLTKVSSALAGESQTFQAHTQCNGVVSEDQLYAQLADEMNRRPPDVQYMMTSAANTAKTYLRNGYQVLFGNIRLRPVVKGGFPNKDSSFTFGRNALEVVATATGDLRNCLDGITPVNVVSKPTPVINSVGDSVTGLESVLTVGNLVYVAGKWLGPDAANADEGCFLCNPSTGETAATGTITLGDLQIVNVEFATWPEPGKYEFVLKTRSGYSTEYSVASASKSVTVIAAS